MLKLTLPLCFAGLAGSLAFVALAASPGDDPEPIGDKPGQFVAAEQASESKSARLSLSPEALERAQSRDLLPAGVKSLLRVPRSLKHGEYVWNDDGVPDGEMNIHVDLRRQMISIFRDGHEIGTAVIVYGGDGYESPTGTFPIRSKHRDYHSRTYDAPMPYSMFITTDGVALHGSPMSKFRATHGCIGLPLEFARRIFEAMEKGDTVRIVRSTT